jgi:hypothetical protein
VSFDLQNSNTLIAIVGGLIIIGGSAVAVLKFLFGLNSKLESVTNVLKKQTEVQEKMSEKIGDMSNEFSRFAGATEARLDSVERDINRK